MAHRDDEPVFRPRMGRRPRRDTEGLSFRQFMLSRIGRAAQSVRRKARSNIAVGRPGADARRVVVKAHVVRLTAYGAKAAALHLRYIQRDGIERDGSPG